MYIMNVFTICYIMCTYTTCMHIYKHVQLIYSILRMCIQTLTIHIHPYYTYTLIQALSWNEDDDIGITNKSKALKIVVLQGLFHPSDFNATDLKFEKDLEEDIASECSKCGEIEKITLFTNNINGIIIVKYKTSYAALECITLMNNRYFGGNKIRAFFWDGVTDYTVAAPTNDSVTGGMSGSGESSVDAAEREEEHRLDEFGDWLEQGQDDLPEEFQLRTE